MSYGGLQNCPPQANTTLVAAGATVALDCVSNDNNTIFKFWEFGNGKIIGPDNDYDETKYKYQVLSGRLFIKNFSPDESGCYNCYSQKIYEASHKVGSVQLITRDVAQMSSKIIALPDTAYQSDIDGAKLAAIILSICVIIGCGIIYFLLRKEWSKYDGRMVVSIHDDDEEGDEIYNRTTTNIISPVAGPSRNTSSDHLYGIENQGLDTDFNSVFEQIQIKTPEHSLI